MGTKFCLLMGSVVVTMATVSGCGSSDSSGGNTSTPLTSAQTAEVKSTLSSALRTKNAANAANGNSGSSTDLVDFAALSTGQPPSTGHLKDMSQRFQDPSLCTVTAPQPNATDPTQGLNSSTELSVSGTNCPVSFDFKTAMTSSDPTTSPITINSSTSLKYAVAANQPDFEALNDVDAIDFSDVTTITVTQSNLNGTETVKGSIHSQQYGTIQINGTGTISAGQNNGGQSSETITLTYPDFTAVIGVTTPIDGSGKQGTPAYTLNGQTVTQDQLQQLLDSANQ